MGDALGWTATASWTEDGRYVTTRPSAQLMALLAPYLMAPGDWTRFFPQAPVVQLAATGEPTP